MSERYYSDPKVVFIYLFIYLFILRVRELELAEKYTELERKLRGLTEKDGTYFVLSNTVCFRC